MRFAELVEGSRVKNLDEFLKNYAQSIRKKEDWKKIAAVEKRKTAIYFTDGVVAIEIPMLFPDGILKRIAVMIAKRDGKKKVEEFMEKKGISGKVSVSVRWE